MPAVSKAQQTAMAIAEHEPRKLYGRNKGMLSMSKEQLHDFASGSKKGKPEHVKDGSKEHHRRHMSEAIRKAHKEFVAKYRNRGEENPHNSIRV